MDPARLLENQAGITGFERTVIVSKACDTCKKKKRRCDILGDSCTQCIKADIPCTFTQIKQKKGPRKPPGYKHVEKLEERLKRMEAMLRSESRTILAGSDTEGAQSDADLSSNYVRVHSRGESSESQSGRKRKRRTSTENFSSSISNTEEQVSVSPPKPHLPTTIILHHGPLDWSLTGAFTPKPLPSRVDAQLLIQETFSSFNSAFPIFDAKAFQDKFESSYENNIHDSSAWQACLNVVFAFAHRFRAMETGDSKAEDFHACGYLKNALALVGELSMSKNDLAAVQALLGMAILLQGTPNPEPGPILISMAVKLAQGMKLHRRSHYPGIVAAEVEQRKRVFWLVYIYDKDMSIRTDNPPAQDDDDMDIDLPSETIDLDNDRFDEVNFYNNHIGMSIIQGQIYKQLLSTRAQRSTEVDRLRNAKELVTTLETWKQNIPCMLDIEKIILKYGAPSFFILLHTAILKFTYFQALDILRRVAHTAELDALCLLEARESMQLFQLLPQGDFAHVWLLLDIIMSACSLILTHTVSPPNAQHESQDLQLVEPVFVLLGLLKETSKAKEVAKMAESLKAQKQVRFGGVPAGEKKTIQSLEDFVARIKELSSEKCAEFRATGLRDE